METTVDGAGRIVIPKALRERLGLAGGTAVELTEVDGAILLRPAGASVRRSKRRGRPVLDVDGAVEPLTVDAVRELVERGRR